MRAPVTSVGLEGPRSFRSTSWPRYSPTSTSGDEGICCVEGGPEGCPLLVLLGGLAPPQQIAPVTR